MYLQTSKRMDTISILSYYFNMILAYGNYYLLYIIEIFRDYPLEVQIAAIATTIWAIIITLIFTELTRQTFRKKRKRKTIEHIHEFFGNSVKHILWDEDVSDDLSRNDIIKIMGLDQSRFIGKKLLKNKLEKQVFCRMIYDLIIHDQMREGRIKNLHHILDIFLIPKFLEDDVNYGTQWNKVSSITMMRTFKIYISPWVINKLLENKSKRIRRLAMYSMVRAGSEGDLDVFETDFYEKNCCIYDEIMIGYELQRRKKSGIRLPSMAMWAERFNSPEVKCMLVRMMRRFEQRDSCSMLMPLFDSTHHKKLIEEICRTWGYLQYKDSENVLSEAFPLQTDDTKVAIMHAIARFYTGKHLDMFTYAYESSSNPHLRFEALRCLYNYGSKGKMKLRELERNASEKDKKYFAFFHNPITLQKIPLDELQIYHQTIETSFVGN